MFGLGPAEIFVILLLFFLYPVLFLITVIILLTLAFRLVNAVEKIANKIVIKAD